MGAPLILSGEFTPIYWNVAFQRKGAESWWDFLSPPDLRHVLAYGYVPTADCWLVADPQEKRLALSIVPDAAFDALHEQIAGASSRIVRIEGKESGVYTGRLMQTCATIIARLVGVRSAWRPVALLKHLMAEGAELRHVDQGQGPESRSRNESPASAG